MSWSRRAAVRTRIVADVDHVDCGSAQMVLGGGEEGGAFLELVKVRGKEGEDGGRHLSR